MKSVITLVALSDHPELRELMLDASRRDGGHQAPMATHVFLRDGVEVVGAAGIAVPTLTFWAATTATLRESIEMTSLAHARAFAVHDKFLCPCSPESPFFKLMPRLGYRRLGPADFFEHV
jgi:hypothetical protein